MMVSLHSSPLSLLRQHAVLVPAMEALHAMEKRATHEDGRVCEKRRPGSDVSSGRVGICHL